MLPPAESHRVSVEGGVDNPIVGQAVSPLRTVQEVKLEDGLVEERMRVDRRILEVMIQGLRTPPIGVYTIYPVCVGVSVGVWVCGCVAVSVYTDMRLCVRVFSVYVSVFFNIYYIYILTIYKLVLISTSLYKWSYVSTSVYLFTLFIYVYVRMYMCVCITHMFFTHNYVNTHTHTHTHIFINYRRTHVSAYIEMGRRGGETDG